MEQKKSALVPVKGHAYLMRDPEGGKVVVKLNELPDPDRVFCAQVVRIDRDASNSHQVSFGQRVPGPRVVSVVTLQMDGRSLRDLAATLDADFQFSVNRQAGDGAAACDLTDAEIAATPSDRMALFKATLARCTVGGTGAQIDWYELAPRALHQIGRDIGGGSGAVSIVTIAMSAACMKRFIEMVLMRAREDEVASSARGEVG